MVTMMTIDRLKALFARALQNAVGLIIPPQRAALGGRFYISVDDGPWVPAKNTVVYEGLDAMLSCYFNSGAPPTGFYLAPFTNNTDPSPALTAATFTATQGEYVGYTEATRQTWVPNGNSVGQVMSSSDAPAVFTIGAAPASLLGAALIASASVKGSGTGKLIAAALFPVANTLNPGSTFKLWYSIGATPAP
jgi:hypothetical protein